MSYNQELQGRFTSTGNAQFIPMPNGCDWIETTNIDTWTADGAGTGVRFRWQNGMANGTALEETKTAMTNALTATTTATGFTFVDQSINEPSAAEEVTAVANGGGGIVVTSALAVSIGDIVILSNITDGLQVCGINFTVTATNPGVSFTLGYAPATGAIAAPGDNAFARRIPYLPMFYPSARVITTLTPGASTTDITLNVTCQYLIGQKVRVELPPIPGSTFTTIRDVTITAVNTATNVITVDQVLPAYTFPTNAQVPTNVAQVIPIGQNTAYSLANNVNLTNGAKYNIAQIGMYLAAGTHGPAGVATNVIYWRAGTADQVTNV